ncbi:MAG: hypothetical protein FWG79_05030, partial [Bacteroidales bacterium]|nr:hypothetical protein [Bacteroidales bacterium]
MKKILTSITLISLACSTFSQGHNEQVTVIAPYQPILMGQAYKINVSPQTIDSALIPREARFDIFSRKVPTTFGIDNIRPARVAGEPISKLSPLYVRAGGGNYGTAYGELFFGSLRSAKWNYGTHLKHRSSQGKFKDHEVPYDNSENYARIFGDYYAKKVLLSADFYYDRKRVSAYGALPLFLDSNSNFIDDKLYKRVYQNIGGNIGFSDNNTELSGWKYSGNLAMNWFQSAPSIDEFSLAFDGNIHQTFDFGHYIFNQTVVGLDVSVDLDGLNDVLSHRTSADDPGFTGNKNMKMFKFHPYGKLRFSGHDFSLGLRVNIFDEPGDTNFINDLPVFPDKKIRLKTAAQFVPTVQLKFNLIDNLLAIEFGMDGNVEYLTTRKIAKRNLFLSPSFFPYDIYTTAPLYRAELYREYYLGLNTML